jgi:hypothetical protein
VKNAKKNDKPYSKEEERIRYLMYFNHYGTTRERKEGKREGMAAGQNFGLFNSIKSTLVIVDPGGVGKGPPGKLIRDGAVTLDSYRLRISFPFPLAQSLADGTCLN